LLLSFGAALSTNLTAVTTFFQRAQATLSLFDALNVVLFVFEDTFVLEIYLLGAFGVSLCFGFSDVASFHLGREVCLNVFNSSDLLIFLLTQDANREPQLLLLLSPNLEVFFSLAAGLFQLRNSFLNCLDARQRLLLGPDQGFEFFFSLSSFSCCCFAWERVS
jgi:hypothetical protein